MAWLIHAVTHAQILQPQDTGVKSFVVWKGTDDFRANMTIAMHIVKALVTRSADVNTQDALKDVYDELMEFVSSISKALGHRVRIPWRDLHTSNVFVQADADDGMDVDEND